MTTPSQHQPPAANNAPTNPIDRTAAAVDLHRRKSTLGAAAWLAVQTSPFAAPALGSALLAAGAAQPRAALAQASGRSSVLVELLRAPAWIESAGQRLPLAVGSTLGPLQTVVTGEGARLVLKFAEGSMVALGANSRLTIETLAYGKTDANSFFEAGFRLAVGTFRYVTSLTEKLNGRNRRVSFTTPTATIGIRGTRFWAQANAEHEIVCLFEGKVDISRDNEALAVLQEPNAFWQAPAGQPALPVSIASPDQLRSFGGQVAAPEGSGLAQPGASFSIATNVWLESRANALAERLAQLGYVASVTPCTTGAVNMFDVTISSLASEADARAVAAQLLGLVQRNFELVAASR